MRLIFAICCMSDLYQSVEGENEKLLVVSRFDGSLQKVADIKLGDEIVKVDDTFVSEFDDPMSTIALVRVLFRGRIRAVQDLGW